MREIIFRAKGKDNNEWVYGNLVHSIFFERKTNENLYYILNVSDLDFDCFEDLTDECGYVSVDKNTIGQYTGLKDKNGDRIFEGDYLNISQYPFVCDGVINYYGEVKWLDDEMVFALITHKCSNSLVKGISDGNAELLNEYDCGAVEIIGNIHDKD